MKIEKQFFTGLNDDIRKIREKVFVEEQGFVDEFDELDEYNASIHLLLYIDEIPVATGRLYVDSLDPSIYNIGRVAVLKEYRSLHLGNKIISCLEEKTREIGGTKIQLSAQCRVQGFYEKNGYTAIGDAYLDQFCPHILMEKFI